MGFSSIKHAVYEATERNFERFTVIESYALGEINISGELCARGNQENMSKEKLRMLTSKFVEFDKTFNELM